VARCKNTVKQDGEGIQKAKTNAILPLNSMIARRSVYSREEEFGFQWKTNSQHKTHYFNGMDRQKMEPVYGGGGSAGMLAVLQILINTAWG
jgi:hypothetical protein